ncbi:MAG: hypothetical protein PV353_00180, partial [Bartonella sp.]|nr:hypothetical protein [Bartonella sp.]
SIIAARDFGWISFEDTIMRIKCTLTTLEKMEKFRGHLYNWYETDTLKPLLPTYVSTVDSGNLAGHLITLSSALSEWAEVPDAFLQSNLDGLFDISNILEEILKEIPDNLKFLYPFHQQIKEHIAHFHNSVSELKAKSETVMNISRLSITARNIVQLINELDKIIQTKESAHMLSWAKCLIENCEAYNHDITNNYNIKELCKELNTLSEKARQIALDMKFDFLEQSEHQLLSIGYRVQENKLDESCYDLLASEARLSSLFA